jgi:hypothetical protein
MVELPIEENSQIKDEKFKQRIILQLQPSEGD